MPEGCSYHPRCPLADEECESSDPDYQAVSDQHNVACYHWDQAAAEIPFNIEGDSGTNTTMHSDTTESGRDDQPHPDTAEPAGDER